MDCPFISRYFSFLFDVDILSIFWECRAWDYLNPTEFSFNEQGGKYWIMKKIRYPVNLLLGTILTLIIFCVTESLPIRVRGLTFIVMMYCPVVFGLGLNMPSWGVRGASKMTPRDFWPFIAAQKRIWGVRLSTVFLSNPIFEKTKWGPFF